MMRFTKKLTGVILSLCLLVSVAVVGVVPAAATAADDTLAQETIQGSNILHCFNWSYNNIKAALPDIAEAGYTAVQTSPVQRPKDYDSSYTDTSGQWWKMYQPLGFSIAANGTTWLGTKAELTSLCNTADDYGIKVIVDIVANHLGNNGTDGGTYSYLHSDVETDMKNANYYHTNNTRTNDNNRYNITQYHLGMPDLNTGDTHVQQRALGLLEECIDCGVDGFRFDAAKHIETPNDSGNIASQFWPVVIEGAKEYAEENGKAEPFFYGEILGSAGPNFDISNYTQYMAVTDNYTGDLALDKTYWQWAPELADSTYQKGASAAKSVLWVESHDTYMGNSGSAYFANTKNVSSDVLNKAWAIVGSRADSTALFFARPNDTMGAASSDTNWKSAVVREVNKFKNHFNGTTEFLTNSGNTIAYNERGNSGVVIVNLDGSGSVSLTANRMANGTYTDQITGNTFTVSNGTISGTVGSTGVAVVYNKTESAIDYIETSPLYFKPASNWFTECDHFAMYVFGSSGEAWASMTDDDGDGYYSATLPSGNWTNVIFVGLQTGTTGNNWSNKKIQTADLVPDDGTNCFTISSGTNGSWSAYTPQGGTTQPTTVAPTTVQPTTVQPTTTAADDTYTIYAINNAGWDTVKVYYWPEHGHGWPGQTMTSLSGTKVYTFAVPNDVEGIIFNNGTQQTVNITSGIADGAVWTINSTTSDGKYTVSEQPTYYLVGSMNSWTNNNDYAFSLCASDSGQVEYKLSDVTLAAGATMKVHSSTDTWYPAGTNNDYTVPSDGTYDVYFRPAGNAGSGWHGGYFKVVKPCTITWKDGDGNTLKTETVDSGTTPTYSGATPTKTATAQYSYTFNNTWDPTPAAVTGDATYTAQFTSTLRTYTVTWKNYNGNTLETDENVAYGTTPSYDGQTPTKPSDAQTTYSFSGWSPEVSAVTGDVTYIAQFTDSTNTYTVTWKNDDGSILETDENVAYGDTPAYNGATPTKAATFQNTYTFSGWTPQVVSVTGNVTYTAQFSETPVGVNAITVNNAIGWDDVYVYYWKNIGADEAIHNVWPGDAMTADADLFTFTATVPANVDGIIFTDGAQSQTRQTADITTGIDDGAHWAVSLHNNAITVNPVPIYSLVGSPYGWSPNANTPTFTAIKNDDGLEEYKLSGAVLPADAELKVYGSDSTWYPDGERNNYEVASAGTYDIYFRPHGDGNNDWYEGYFYLVNVTPCAVTWKDGDGNILKTETVTYGDTPVYSGETPTRTATAQYSYTFNNTWDPAPAAVTGDTTYTAQFSSTLRTYTVTWKNYNGITLETDENVAYGTTPSYDGETPTKATEGHSVYAFSGWSPAVAPIEGDAEYTAQFSVTTTSHTYSATGWTWSADNTATSVALRCDICRDPQTVNATVTKDAVNGEITYTATATYNGQTFTDAKTVPRDTLFSGHSLTLGGDIGVNFYLNLTPVEVAQGVTVDFIWFDKHLDSVPVSFDEDLGKYYAACPVAVAEMTYEITATVTIGEEEQGVNTYSVKDYADYIRTNEAYIAAYTQAYGAEAYLKLKKVVEAMLDYGAAAQARFIRDTEHPANDGIQRCTDEVSITYTGSDMDTDLTNYGLTYEGSTVIYLSKTALRHYYTVTDWDTFNTFAEGITMDGSPIAYGQRDGMIYFEIPEIKAAEMGEKHTLHIGTTDYQYSVTDFFAKLLATSTNDAAKNLAEAGYRYYDAAKAYF